VAWLGVNGEELGGRVGDNDQVATDFDVKASLAYLCGARRHLVAAILPNREAVTSL
jgi:hypothetical protein